MADPDAPVSLTPAALANRRARDPGAVRRAAARRTRRAAPSGPGRGLLIIAADHAARGSLGAGPRPDAMADRGELLDRLGVALRRPGVDGVLGTADLLEDLLLAGLLDDRLVIGSMNRGGLAGSVFEADDRFTGYDAASIAAHGFDGGKMLLRIDPGDPACATALQRCALAVTELAGAGSLALVEPFMATRLDGGLRNDLSPDAMIHAITIASALGTTSAYTWLKVPVVTDMDRVLAASTLPKLLLGGDVAADQDATYRAWRAALAHPTVYGLVAGRTLLYPPDDDVASAVDRATDLL